MVRPAMPNGNLATYLNDHLAGSVVALELLEHLERIHAGTELARLIRHLRGDITADRADLEALMKRLTISDSPPRKAMAWVSEKFAEIKLGLDDSAGGPLHLLEALELIAIGIEGKRALWRSLARACVPGISPAELQRLERRAAEQRERIEIARLDAAAAALESRPSNRALPSEG